MLFWPLIFRLRFHFLIILISGNHTEFSSNVLFMAFCEHHLRLDCSYFCARVCGEAKNQKKWWAERNKRVVWGERSSISARWWVYASSLPTDPEAMTSHPSPYARIHFTFISTNNDFAPMKGKEGRLKHLLGRSGIFFLKWQLVVLLETAASRYIAITKVT